MDFTHLHCHSHYSLLDGLSKIDLLVDRASELNFKSLAITDHGVLYGAIEFYNNCREYGIKPIIGMEAYVAIRSRFDRESGIDNDYYHLTLLAKNYEGYQNLLKLATLSHTEGFYYKPKIDRELMKAYSSGIIALSGCPRGEVTRAAGTSVDLGLQKLKEHQNIFGKENFFIEIQRNFLTEAEKWEKINTNLIELSKVSNTPLVATADCHYINTDDAEAQDVLVCIGIGKTINDSSRLDMRSHDLSLKSAEDMIKSFKDLPQAIESTQVIADMVNLEIPIDQRYFPSVELPPNITAEDYLKKIVHEQSKPLYGVGENLEVPEDIVKRIDYELNIICGKGFATYFIMVADIVEGAHTIGAITNTRGSAAGSIVGRILKITNVDPLYYQLPFERFLTMHRPTPPDIDLDISDTKRDAAIAWITQRYGEDKVAQIITFGTMMARAAVRDVGRALGIAYGKCDRIAKMIPIGKQGFHMTLDTAIELSPELKEAYQKDPETNMIIRIAKKLEGVARHASIHAAGIIITPMPIMDIVPLQKEPGGDRLITQYDMYSLDVNAKGNAIGAIKMDLLGIRNLSILELAVDLVEKRRGVKVDIYNLPHPDKKTFELLSAGYTYGIFQLGSAGMTRYLKELKPSSVFDISAMIALYRPGPLQFIPDYIARKHNPRLIKYLDPKLKDILERTYGILVYQDDLLTIAHDLAGYTWEEVDKFRKAVGKKDPAVMAKQKMNFIEGCIKTSGWDRKKAEEIWAWIEPFAAYGFNKSHSASYAVVGYQTAYMKANYMVEFMAAIMTCESDNMDKIVDCIEECKSLGITVLPPSVNESFSDFTVIDEKTIRFGLSAIKNLGSDVVETIQEARGAIPPLSWQGEGQGEVERSEHANAIINPFTTLEDFLIRCYTKTFNKRSWEALVKSGSLDMFGTRGMLLANTEKALDFIRQYNKLLNEESNTLFGKSFLKPRLQLTDAPPLDEEEQLVFEKEHLGLYVSSHPLKKYVAVRKEFPKITKIKTAHPGASIKIAGITSKFKKMITKKNDLMAFFNLNDETAGVEVVIFPKTLKQITISLADDLVVEVRGKISDRDEEVKIIADEVKILPSDDVYLLALNEMQSSQRLVIHLAAAGNKDALGRIKTTLENHPGNSQVFLKLISEQGEQDIKTKTLVDINTDLLSELRKITEIENVTAS